MLPHVLHISFFLNLVKCEIFVLFQVVFGTPLVLTLIEILSCVVHSGASLKTLSPNRSEFRSSHQRCSMEKVVLRNLANSQENTFARVSFLMKLQVLGLRPTTLLKKRL